MLPISEAENHKIINVILMIINIYSPKCKGVDPSLFVKLTSPPFDNKISTISLCPHLEAVNKTKLVNHKKSYTEYLLTIM